MGYRDHRGDVTVVREMCWPYDRHWQDRGSCDRCYGGVTVFRECNSPQKVVRIIRESNWRGVVVM